MSPVSVDVEELIMAFEHHDAMGEHYLDRKTGKILYVSEDYMYEENMQQLRAEPKRYLLIETVDSSTGFEVMADFAESLPIGEARRELEYALNQRHPFRSFKDVLLNYPKVREEWFRFHEEAFTQIAQDWLEANMIEATLTKRNYPASGDLK